MKRTILFAASIAAAGILALIPATKAPALTDIALPTDGSFYDGPAAKRSLTNAVHTLSNNVVLAITAQVPATGAVTQVAAYTPRRVGDVLMGYLGHPTQAIWIAYGSTTSSWVQVKP